MNMRIASALIVLTLPSIASADCGSWARTLKPGSRGEDVRALQIYLNTNDTTRVTLTGTGSRGYESTTFGKATARAVARFQSAHGIEATGIFGPLTRAEFIRLACTAAASATTSTILPVKITPPIDPSIFSKPAAQNTPAPSAPTGAVTPAGPSVALPTLSLDTLDPKMNEALSKSSDIFARMGTPLTDLAATARYLVIGDPTPNSAHAGQTVSLSGNGFITGAKVALGGNTVAFTPTTPNNGTFIIPTNMKPGLYDLRLSVNGSDSNIVRIAITEDGAAPVIKSIDPTSGNVGTSITITGTGFLGKNDIEAGSYTATDVASDGKTIRFTLSADPMFLGDGKLMKSYPLFIRVRNIHGTSNSLRLNIE